MIGQETATLPELPLEAWQPTKETMHLWAQVVGKIKMAATPPKNHWWHVPMYVDVRGLTTGRMRYDGVAFSIDFDLVDHLLVLHAEGGRREELALRDGLSVARFYETLFGWLDGLGVDLIIKAEPYKLPTTTPFAEDREHAAYDPVWVERYWRVLSWTDGVLQRFSGWFTGKTSPVQLYWHSFDLALTRFSGRPAPAAPDADPVTREAYTHEVISFGLWPGDRQTPDAALYAYAHPEPRGLAAKPLRPDTASWAPAGDTHLAILPWREVCRADDPRALALEFLQAAYEAGTAAAHWPAAELSSTWCPPEVCGR